MNFEAFDTILESNRISTYYRRMNQWKINCYGTVPVMVKVRWLQIDSKTKISSYSNFVVK